MNREFVLELGKRFKVPPGDKSCTFGVVFGSAVAEIEQKFISVCYIDRPTEDVLVVMCDMFIIHHNAYGDYDREKKEIAYRNIDKRTANDLEKLLRYVIDGRIDYATYQKEKTEIEEKLKKSKL